MSRHTPGPWGADVFVPISGAYDAGLNIGFLCTSNAAKRAEAEANARLIAAAPDLLADLRVAAETLRRYETLHRAKGTGDGLQKAEANRLLAMRFEATIAKATGGAGQCPST